MPRSARRPPANLTPGESRPASRQAAIAAPSSLAVVRRDVRDLADPDRAVALQAYFKTGPGQYAEGDRFLGLTVPQLRGLARTHSSLTLSDITRLLESQWHEERLLALLMMVRRFQAGDAEARRRIRRLYLMHRQQVNNWDLVDLSAPAILGAPLVGRSSDQLDRLAGSRRLWDRRMAMVATLYDIKAGRLDRAVRIARRLLDDPHDLIHKAVGWMLREVGKCDRPTLEAFLRRHAGAMPRTTLRYAIERFSEEDRKRYLRLRSN